MDGLENRGQILISLRMMNRFVSAVVVSVVILSAARPLSCAQNVSVIPLVPAADWRLTATRELGVDEIRNYGGDPVVEREYGVKSFQLRTYQLGRTTVEVVLEPADDVSAAFGLFTYYQNESMHPEKAVQLAMTGPEVSLMARGRTFVRFLRPEASHFFENEFRALLIFVGGTRPTSDSLSNLPPPLPSIGLIPGSEKYIIGPEVARRVLPKFRTDLLGFDRGAEVQIGEYLVGHSPSTMMEVSYPTPQMARARFAAMSDLLALNQERGANTLYARREGSFILLVLKANNKAAATKLLDQFNVTEQLSWDEKYPGDKTIGRQLFELILGNVFLTSFLAGAGIVGGVLIVLSRRVTALLFPDWQWGHPEADRLIRLNLQ
jgi:hypothetical protein